MSPKDRNREPSPSEGRSAGRSGLFAKIYLTLVLTVLGAALTAAVGTWFVLHRQGTAWVADTIDTLGDAHDDLMEALDEPSELQARIDRLARHIEVRIAIYDLRGHKIAGQGQARVPRMARRVPRQLRRGHPVVRDRENRRGPPVVLYPITSQGGRLLAVAHVRPDARDPSTPLAVTGALMLGFLGLGAWGLSRSLTRRLSRLERSVDRIAKGELDHRVSLDHAGVRDELDELGVAFNDMAEELQRLIAGQRTLLANVSHELRTPISRVKVLLEILEERIEGLEQTVGIEDRNLRRLRDGLADLSRDTAEIETLISDLLTSGRLELRGGAAGLMTEPTDVASLLERIAARFDARVEGRKDVELELDPMLVERMFSNLLANARRASPEGELVAQLRDMPHQVEVAVIDEGPGIVPEHRETIFEPFTRLDDARNRDRGGVGLGLYLCRQISRAHGGDIRATDREDGRRGARMVVTLPRRDDGSTR